MRRLELVSVAMFVCLLPFAAFNKAEGGSHAIAGCNDMCGTVIIKYPFGYGISNENRQNCFLTPAFEVNCTNDVPSLQNADQYKVFNISEIKFPNQVVLESYKILAVDCKCSANASVLTQNVSFDFKKPFTVSAKANRFRAMGCNTTAYIKNKNETFTSRCDTQWEINSGLGQVNIAVPQGSSGFNYSVKENFQEQSVCSSHCGCSFALLADQNSTITYEVFQSYQKEPTKVNTSNKYPLVAEWAIEDGLCKDNHSSTCGENAFCNYTASGENAFCNYTASQSGRYHCYCKKDYDGNPYLNGPDGCQNGESQFPTVLVAIVFWIPELRLFVSIIKRSSILAITRAGGALLAGTLGAGSYSYGSRAQKKAIMKLTSKLLKELQNAGDVSSPDIPVVDPDTYSDVGDPSSFDGDGGPDANLDDPNAGDGGPDTNPDDPDAGTKDPMDFNQQDLRKAIKLYQKGRRIAVWASRLAVAIANLPSQGSVEIRKYTIQERSQLPLFVKGVRTLSRTVIHANVARLLGISTRERSLIYKHFSDRTLHDCLHGSPSDSPSWEERLKIAVGTARGLAFAHSKGLYHGNVKSSNILLDEKCNCKLVEFGVARVLRKNTLLNSSRGYVDPEYMNSKTNKLTAAMDVYSFGVVLVELITGQDPSYKGFNGRGRSLAMVFVSAVDEGRLAEVVDNSIWAEERKEQLLDIAKLAKECLQQGEKRRPEMLRVRKILLKWAPKGPTPQGATPKNAAGSRSGVPRNSELQDRIENTLGQIQSGFDMGQNVTQDCAQGGDDGEILEF